jgi:uncharacterized protein (DUF1810 family)
MHDPFDLARFVDAQAGTYETALAELRRGRKSTHWMWFIFPQIRGLGTSVTSQRYAIRSRAEAVSYLEHLVLGPRYRECVATLQDLGPGRPENVFGAVDARKLQSSLTLFSTVDAAPLFVAALDRWFDGQRDASTLRELSGNI